jgi:UDP-N-acetyl-D-glucosamine dehydrogenase
MLSAPEQMLEGRIATKATRVGVVGLGYVGLPLAVECARAGMTVVGVDTDEAKVRALGEGRSYNLDVREDAIRSVTQNGRLTASTGYDALKGADVLIICVPTPLTKIKEPDLSYIVEAVTACVPALRTAMLVILESTTYPGTTVEIVKPILERSGLTAGVDFALAFSPERIDPGNLAYRFHEVPKVVGGLTPACTRLAAQFYGRIVERVVPVASPTLAEMVKVYENVFRNVNIALVNELTLLCDRMGLDVWDVIDAAATKPYGFVPFYPGPGVGGHCIPVDPYYLLAKAREYDFHARFIELAATVNDSMPYYVISRTHTALESRGKTLRGANVLVLGVAYKRDVADARMSPATKIIELLGKRGAHIRYHDPHVLEISMPNPGRLTSIPLTDDALRSSDCVIIVTDHSAVDYDRVLAHAPLIVDTRNRLRKVAGRDEARHVLTL